MFATFDLVVDSVDGVDRPHEKPLRFSIPSDLIFRCGQSGQFHSINGSKLSGNPSSRKVLEIFSKLGLTPYRTHAENGDNSKSKGVPTNLKVPTDSSWKKLSFGAS